MALLALGASFIGALSGSCVSMPFMTVGCSQNASATIVNTLTTSVNNSFRTKTQAQVSNFTSVVNSATINVLPGGQVTCGTLTIDQKAALDANVFTSIDTQITSEVKTELKQIVDNSANALAQDQRDLLARIFGTTSTNAVAMVTNTINTAIEESVTVETMTRIINNATISNNIVLNVAGGFYAEQCVFNQDGALRFYSQSMISEIVTRVNQTSVYQDVANYAQAQASTGKNKGQLWLILGLIIAAILIIGLVIYFVRRSQKRKQAAAASSGPPPQTNVYIAPPPTSASPMTGLQGAVQTTATSASAYPQPPPLFL